MLELDILTRDDIRHHWEKDIYHAKAAAKDFQKLNLLRKSSSSFEKKNIFFFASVKEDATFNQKWDEIMMQQQKEIDRQSS